MSHPNLPPGEQPDHYAKIAAELRRIADDLAALEGMALPEPYFSIDIHPHGVDDNAIRNAVDAVARALVGKPPTMHKVPAGGYHYTARGGRGLIDISVYDAISDPADREREAELEKLRAEVAELRAAQSGFGYSREADDPTPVSPARMPLQTGGVVDGGQLVDETPPVHLEVPGAKTACGLRIMTIDAGQRWTEHRAAVTCDACIDAAMAQ